MELVHKTEVDEVPSAICGFQGRLLVGVGRMLRLYDMGKKKLLRKCENKVIIIIYEVFHNMEVILSFVLDIDTKLLGFRRQIKYICVCVCFYIFIL